MYFTIKRKEKPPLVITRKHRLYPKLFFIYIMDNSYAPLNQIWHSEKHSLSGTYSKIITGKKNYQSYETWSEKQKKEGFYF